MKLLKIFVILAIVLLTVVVGITSPKLHKTFVITGADFKLERYTEKLSQQQIKTISQKPNSVSRHVNIEPSVFLTEQKKVIQPEIDMPQEKQVVNDTNPQEDIVSQLPLELQEPLSQLMNEMQEEVSDEKLTKHEELIAWNKWRSDIMNEVMISSNVEAPIGTGFYFSFKVDKFRHISNVKGFCTNPLYSSQVGEKLIPAIKKLEYTQMLEFPKGSARNSTSVRGMFAIGTETSLANPDDFNDLERINVYE